MSTLDESDKKFNIDDVDVYEVQAILGKRSGQNGAMDMYHIKWVGYSETTWEPADNVSKIAIDEFESKRKLEAFDEDDEE